MAELINTPTTLGCLFSRCTQGEETGTPNFIKTFYFNGRPCIGFICIVLFFYVGFYDYVIFMFCPKEKTHLMKQLFTDVDSLHVNVWKSTRRAAQIQSRQI